MAEFNIADDHVGDIVLDFEAGCVSNCGGDSLTAVNSGNGSDSTNTADVSSQTDNTTFQNNDAEVENNMVLSADSGNNTASQNTNGDSTIDTGDANVSANVLTFANNNISGNVVYTVVNIFGDLVGDIIMPDDYLNSGNNCSTCQNSNTKAENSGNGADSVNNAAVAESETNNTFQTNDANIENNLIVDANTSGNSASKNTGGDSEITTGDSNINAKVVNVANSNVSDGNWWLVIVNDAGRWIGKIMGAPDGATLAGSEGTEFTVNDAGEIVAVNSGNGADSTNNSAVNQNTENTTIQSNTANIVNNVNISANTGGNQTSKNTGGNSSITTGDTNVVANMVNFVNNNISGKGKLFVTVINVFGTWVGDFVSPGTKKDNLAQGSTPPVADSANDSTPTQPDKIVEEDPIVTTSSGSTTNSQPKIKRITKKTKVTIAKKKQIFTSKPQLSGTLVQGGSAVAGVKLENNQFPEDALSEILASKKMKINLAWLLLLIPFIALIILSRLKIAHYSTLLKKKFLAVPLAAVCLYVISKFNH